MMNDGLSAIKIDGDVKYSMSEESRFNEPTGSRAESGRDLVRGKSRRCCHRSYSI